MEDFAQRAPRGTRVPFPALDQSPVIVFDAVRGSAPLHRALGLWDAGIEIRERRECRCGLVFDRRPVARELAVLEHDGLLCLVEHRRELEIARELAVERGRRLGQGGTPRRVCPQRSCEPRRRRADRHDDAGDHVGHGRLA